MSEVQSPLPEPVLILTIAKVNWVLGLVWQTYSSTPAKGFALSEAHALGTDLYIQVPGRTYGDAIFYDFGFGHGSASPRMYSAAAALASIHYQRDQSAWASIYDLGHGRYLWLLVLDGGSPAEEFIGDRDTVLARAKHWEEECSIGYEDEPLGALEQALNSLKPQAKFAVNSIRERNEGLRKNIAIAISGTVLLAVIGMGWWFYQQQQIAEKITAHATIPSAAAQKAEPTVNIVRPSVFLNRCHNWVRQVRRVTVGGWNAEQIVCSPNELSIQWGGGQSSRLKPEGKLSDDGRVVLQKISKDAIGPGQAQKPRAVDLTAGDLTELLKQVDMSLAFEVAGKGKRFRIKGEIAPWDIPLDIDGVSLTTLKMTSSGWELEGEIQ